MLAAADARRTAASGKNTVCSVKNRVQYTIYGLSTEYGDNPVEDRLSSLFTEKVQTLYFLHPVWSIIPGDACNSCHFITTTTAVIFTKRDRFSERHNIHKNERMHCSLYR